MTKSLIFLFLLVFCGIVTLPGCRNKMNNTEISGKKKNKTESLKFTTYRCIDQHGTGVEAFHFLIPENWKFEGGVTWVYDKPAMPATSAFRVYDPNGTAEFEVFPNQSFFWTNNPNILNFYPAGAKYFGNEVRQPVSALDAMSGIMLPLFRQQYANLKVINRKQLPELAQALTAGNKQQGATQSADGCSTRIEYDDNGKTIEEEIYCVVEQLSFNTSGMFGTYFNIYWYVDYIFSFKAEKGQLEKNSKPLQTIAYSFKLNPLWYSKYSQVIEYLARMQIQRIHSVGEFSRILSQTRNEISDMMMESYNQRQEVNDKINQNFSDYMLGIDRYYDPYSEQQVELPSGYKQAWANNLGEYIVSDDPDFNPNQVSNQNWQELERK